MFVSPSGVLSVASPCPADSGEGLTLRSRDAVVHLSPSRLSFLNGATMSTFTNRNDYFDSDFPILGGVGNTGGDDAL